jgi:hypothetical protein
MPRLFLLILLTCLPIAEVSPTWGQSSDGYLLSSVQDITVSEAYRTYQRYRDQGLSEVYYLIDLIRQSPHKFVRNGKEYQGDIAAKFLSYKLNKNLRKVKTTENFIDLVATRSEESDREYLIVFTDGSTRPTREVLLSELERLRTHERDYLGFISPDQVAFDFSMRMRQFLIILLAIFIAHEWLSSWFSARKSNVEMDSKS